MLKFGDLRPVDKLNIVGLVAIALTSLIFHHRVQYYFGILVVNCLVILGIIVLVNFHLRSHSALIRSVTRWYTFPLIFLTFKELYLMVHPINPNDLDYLLIRLDRLIFGIDPTSFLDRISTPGLTEFLQISYSSFYLLWIILGIELLRSRNEKGYLFFLFVLMYGFYTSFVGYIFVPAIGPRFTLYDFSRLDKELPGLHLTSFLRNIINSGESITNAAQAAMLAQRDCFPSGHAEMTIITIAMAIKYRAKSAMVIIPLGMGLIFATVYMRYHYGVDVIAGIAFAVFVLSTANWLESRMWSKDQRASISSGYFSRMSKEVEESPSLKE